ncbi:MAG TPA: hypothetical protein VII70_08180 [Steroidobacteraceae bacterium]
MRRLFASALLAGVLAATSGAHAEVAQKPPAATAAAPTASLPKASFAKPSIAPSRNQSGTDAELRPVAVTAKRIHPRLDLRLSSDRLSQVLTESGVEPVAESDTTIDTVEVAAKHIEMEPIQPGIPALYYGITHPSEAWRIFAPIQP